MIYYGTFLEFFEFILFASLFPVLSKSLSLHFTPDAQATLQYSLFWIGFLGRPLGALILGPIADLYNRKTVLVISVVGMSISTMMLGCVPIHASPIVTLSLIAFLRLLQGVFTGAEYATALVYGFEKHEDSPEKRQKTVIYIGMMASLGAGAAYITAGICQLDFLAGLEFWRAAFLLIGFMGLWTGGLRLVNLPDDYKYAESKKTAAKHASPKGMFKKSVIAFFLVAMSSGPYYYITTFLNTHGVVLQQTNPPMAFFLNAFVALFYCVILWGLLKFLKTRTLTTDIISNFFVMFAAMLWPLSYIIFNSGSAVQSVIAQMMLVLFSQVIVIHIFDIAPSLFAKHVRVRSFAVAQTLSASLTGGAAPLICHGLSSYGGDKVYASLYPILLTLIAYGCYRSLMKLKRKTAIDSPLSVNQS